MGFEAKITCDNCSENAIHPDIIGEKIKEGVHFLTYDLWSIERQPLKYSEKLPIYEVKLYYIGVATVDTVLCWLPKCRDETLFLCGPCAKIFEEKVKTQFDYTYIEKRITEMKKKKEQQL